MTTRLSVKGRLAWSTMAQMKHDVVRQLVEHGWVHLYQIDSDDRVVRAWDGGDWTPLPPA